MNGTDPKREGQQRSNRLRWLRFAMCLVWLGITVRLVSIHLFDGDLMQRRVHEQQTTEETIPARPGDILDRHGRLLATSVETTSVYLVPRTIPNPDEVSAKLAPLVDLEPAELETRLRKNADKGFLWLARRLSEETVKAIRQLELPADQIGFEEEFKRFYPNEHLAAHLIGFRNIDGEGRGGVEQKYNSILQGQNGKRVLVRNARRQIIHLYEKESAPLEQGRTIHLTVDLHSQRQLEAELDRIVAEWQPTGCCGLLCEVHSGDILAMASRPTYTPGDPDTYTDEAWLNRAIAWSYEPGSTIKPLIVAWALQQQVISAQSRFHGHWGAYQMGSRILHDTHPLGEMSLAQILIDSSNIGMAQIGERLTNPLLFSGLQSFGFGSRSGLGFPGELSGSVRPLRDWNLYSTGSIPMGQEMSVTPLQLIVAHATLANRGEFRQPRLLMRVEAEHPGEVNPQLSMPVINPQHASWIIRDPLRRVMSEGTGQRIDVGQLDIYGKTGTSQVYDPELKGYSPNRHVCSFVCGIPAADPELIALIVVDSPTQGQSHYGSTVAAPAAISLLKSSWNSRRLATASDSSQIR